ncbi:hypothetical protein [Streptomyces lincolnensis]|uniref:hypothetical protein n=1 Tax=Streptomyces lincolnensis TaxID=1915 RepID=UPI0037D47B56
MPLTRDFDEYVSDVRDRAAVLNGQSVIVNLVGGSTLTGTLAYVPRPAGWPAGSQEWPKSLTVTVSTKVHTVRLDHVSSLGQA